MVVEVEVDVDVDVDVAVDVVPVNTPGQTAMFFVTAPASATPVVMVIPQQKIVLSWPGGAQVSPEYGLLVPAANAAHMGMLAG